MVFINLIKEFIPNIKNMGSWMDSEQICEYQNAYNIQVVKYDKLVQKSFDRIEIISRILKTKLLTIEVREKLEKEIEEIRRMLDINKQKLDRLRREDRRLFIMVISFIFACFLTYGLYCILTYNQVSTAFVNTM